MDISQAAAMLESASKNFHGEFKKMYGQISLRVDDNNYLTTGGSKILSELVSDDFELCDMGSSDLGVIFNARPDINAMIFAISADTIEASSGEKSMPSCLEDIAMLAGPSVKVIGSASADEILDALNDSNVCLIRGVGALAACSNLKKAAAGILILEKACEAVNHGRMIGGAVPLSADEANACRQTFTDDYTNRNEEAHVDFIGFDEDEFALRSELIEYGKSLVDRDLSYGSWGNLSVRLNDEEMLITPSSMDYFEIKPEDIVRVNINTLDYGAQRQPSSEVPMHAMLYKEHPDASAIVHTHSNAISVFAACEKGFAIQDPSMRELIGDILVTEKAPSGTDRLAEAVAMAMRDTHACIVPHHGAIFYGPSLDLVFAIAESVEQKARNLLAYDSIDSFEDVLDD